MNNETTNEQKEITVGVNYLLIDDVKNQLEIVNRTVLDLKNLQDGDYALGIVYDTLNKKLIECMQKLQYVLNSEQPKEDSNE